MRKAIGFDLGDTLLLYEGVSERWSPSYREALGRAASACGREIGKPEADRAVAVLERYNTRLAPRTLEISETQILGEVTAERVKEYFGGLVEGPVERFELRNRGALNFLLHRALGGGGTVSRRTDAQGKTFGAALLRMEIDL